MSALHAGSLACSANAFAFAQPLADPGLLARGCGFGNHDDIAACLFLLLLTCPLVYWLCKAIASTISYKPTGLPNRRAAMEARETFIARSALAGTIAWGVLISWLLGFNGCETLHATFDDRGPYSDDKGADGQLGYSAFCRSSPEAPKRWVGPWRRNEVVADRDAKDILRDHPEFSREHPRGECSFDSRIRGEKSQANELGR
jgi:hypothetical protein